MGSGKVFCFGDGIPWIRQWLPYKEQQVGPSWPNHCERNCESWWSNWESTSFWWCQASCSSSSGFTSFQPSCEEVPWGYWTWWAGAGSFSIATAILDHSWKCAYSPSLEVLCVLQTAVWGSFEAEDGGSTLGSHHPCRAPFHQYRGGLFRSDFGETGPVSSEALWSALHVLGIPSGSHWDGCFLGHSILH